MLLLSSEDPFFNLLGKKGERLRAASKGATADLFLYTNLLITARGTTRVAAREVPKLLE